MRESAWTRSARLPAPSCSTSFMLPDFERATGSASSGVTQRATPSPNFWSTARRTGRSGRSRRDVAGGRPRSV